VKLTDEFIEAYKDDLIYILGAQRALFTHPLKSVIDKKSAIASFARIYIVTAVNGIEVKMKKWKEHSKILEAYFSEKSTDEERIGALYSAFQKAGINVDFEIFKDYLALKYLRDAIIYGEWIEHKKEWIAQRGFPTNIGKFTEEHLERAKEVVLNMMNYIFHAVFSMKSEKLIRLKEETKKTYKDYGILNVTDLYEIIWNNLGRIDDYIYQDILKVVCSPEYYWASGLSEEQIDSLEHNEKIRLLYLSAYRAGINGHPLLAQHRSLAKDAFVFWLMYWDWVVSQGLNENKIKQALKILRDPNFPVEEKIWSISDLTEREQFEESLNKILENLKIKIPYSIGEISEALFVGKLAYKLFPDITPLTLFTMRLPVIDPENANLYWQEAQRVYDALLLAFTWYECVERNERYVPEKLDLCLKIYKEFFKENKE